MRQRQVVLLVSGLVLNVADMVPAFDGLGNMSDGIDILSLLKSKKQAM
jgi:hypothetical protein